MAGFIFMDEGSGTRDLVACFFNKSRTVQNYLYGVQQICPGISSDALLG